MVRVIVTEITGCAPNLPWWRVRDMTVQEIMAYNGGFLRRETKEFDCNMNLEPEWSE